jgi:DedD protein
MPRSVSDEELVLKKRARRRLIGAIALVTLVIVLLPMFLDSDPRPLNQEISVQIPEQSTPFSSRVAALPASGAEADPGPKAVESPRAESVETGKPVSESERKAVEAEKRTSEQERRAESEKRAAEERAAKVESAPKVETKPAPKPEPKSAAKPESKPEPKATAEASREKGSNGEGFVVQVAALTDVEKAKALRGRIAESGLRAYTEVVRTAKGDVTRVRVGPFGTKDAAQRAAEELKKLGFSGVVAPRS